MISDLQALECAGIDLLPVTTNLIDVVWGGEKPARPCNQLMVLPIKYSGRSFIIIHDKFQTPKILNCRAFLAR